MKKYIISLLFFSSILSASVIPHYQIASIDGNVITFSNNATFAISFSDFIYFTLWEPGNLVEIVYKDSEPLMHHSFEVIGNVISSNPFLRLRNLTRADEEVSAILDTPPPAISLDTFSIVSIDHFSHIITLNDATEWSYSERDEMFIENWEVGHLVMIGRDGNEQFHITDACLLNTTLYQIILAVEL